ncbi:MAG: PQQ-dependent sugar dehydrogenase [Planctomycetota bacterium]|nr:PQQ-dependent sugar dehydrogenase [Planctomycetota bacterium]
MSTRIARRGGVALVAIASGALPALAQIGGAGNISNLWERTCANCHGDEGQGGGAGTRTLLTAALFDQSHDRPFFDAIKNGVPDMGMMAFGKTLSDEQIWALVVHIRELQHRALRRERGSPGARPGSVRSTHHTFRVEEVVKDGLATPWAVAWLPDGSMLITERAGRLRVWKDGVLSPPVADIPKSVEIGQGGLMEVAVHPDYATNGHVYLGYAKAAPGERRPPTMTTISRGKLDLTDPKSPKWTDEKVIWEAKREHFLATGLHFGNNIVFSAPQEGGRRYLYFCIGERGRMEMAQDVTRPNGKVHRVWDDGEVPKDNPFVETTGAYASIWSFGHRNPQGLVFDLNGVLWDTEHGPRGGDELNVVVKGRNYGWPTVSYGINYNDAPFRTPFPDLASGEGHTGKVAEIVMPVFRWLPSIGACGLDVVRSEKFPKWNGDLVAGGLSGENVDRLRVTGDASGSGQLVEREELIHGLGRVRDVACGPDGLVYVVLNGSPDEVGGNNRIVRLVPAE